MVEIPMYNTNSIFTNQLNNTNINFAIPQGNSAKKEFSVLFYKELLKQGFSGEFLGMEGGPYSEMAKDAFIENMARELAEKGEK